MSDVLSVSVVVPNYNHARFLPERIDSILRQTFQDFELILLDDCSTDDSRAILSQYERDPRVRIEFNEVNSGTPFKQWNKGVRLARGKYVWIGESDDWADERLLERLVALLEADESVAFAYCRSWRVIGDHCNSGFADEYPDLVDADDRWTQDFVIDGYEACARYFVFNNPVPNASAVVFRKEIYEAAGGADESFRVCGDWKLWAGMALKGRIAYTAESLNYFRYHEGTARKNNRHRAVNVSESARVIRWVSDRVETKADAPAHYYERLAAYWVPALMSLHVPISRKWEILRDIRAIDPHPWRTAFIPALTTTRLKLVRHWASLRHSASERAS